MQLSIRQTTLIGLSFMSITAFSQVYDNIVPLILSNTFSMGETLTGLIMALDNVLALFLLPYFGHLSDQTNTRLGKRVPFILVGTVLTASSLMLLPIADQQHSLIFFLIVLFLVLIAAGIYRSPAVALMPDLTPKPLRSQANAIINVMGTLGGIYTLLMIRLLVKHAPHPNYLLVFASVSCFMVICVILLIANIHENQLRKEIRLRYPDFDSIESSNDSPMLHTEFSKAAGKGLSGKHTVDLPGDVRHSLNLILISIFLWFMGFNAITTAFSRYAIKIWHMEGGTFANILIVGTVTAVISMYPISLLSTKIGRKRSILIGILMLIVAYAGSSLFFDYSPVIYFFFIVLGIGWAAINVNSYPMVVELCKGSEIGKFTGLYYSFSMAGQILTPILSGFLMEQVSYLTLFPYAAICSLLALFTMSQVRHGDAK